MVFKFKAEKTDKIRLVVFRSNDVNLVGGGWSDERKIENSVARVVEISATGLEKVTSKSSKDIDRSRVKTAPEFALQDLNGNWVRLSHFKGNIVILTFWAAWSSEAQQQVRDLNRISSQYKDQGVTVIGISVDEGGAERIRGFVESNNLNYPILIADTSVKTAYGGIGKLPSTFIIDWDGNIYKEYFGYRGGHLIELDIRNLLLSE